MPLTVDRRIPTKRLIACASGRIPLAPLYGSDKQVNWATQIRARLLSEARRAGNMTALIIIKGVCDAHWFCAQADKPLDWVIWPAVHLLDLPADVAPPEPEQVGRSATPEDLRRHS